MLCNHDCLNCRFEDCINDEEDELDIYKAHLLDKEIEDKHPDINTKHYKYNHSEKRKEVSKRYSATEKGKETHRRSWQNYAKNHPDRVRAKQRLYYERHREEILKRRKENGQSKRT